MVDLGEWILPDHLKFDVEFLYWLKTRNYRLHSKRIIKKINFGEIENRYTIGGYKSLLIMSGVSKQEASLRGAKLYLASKNAR